MTIVQLYVVVAHSK